MLLSKRAVNDGWSTIDRGTKVSTTYLKTFSSNSDCLTPPFLALFDLCSLSTKYSPNWDRCLSLRWFTDNGSNFVKAFNDFGVDGKFINIFIKYIDNIYHVSILFHL